MSDELRSAARHRPELLAPAGDRSALLAALAAGADAVYFGIDEGFNARARAANFPLASLPDTVALIHRAGARAYLTVNTLVFEPELPVIERVLRAAVRAGVDALIVQDPAVALLARALAPAMEVHASTQMTIANADAARFARDLGISRVVLPRELSVAEIRAVAEAGILETEVFVHGALCVSWSGQCLTSEAWGQRSANRGQCAQSCRLPYELVVDGRTVDTGGVDYLLSPKDLAAFRAAKELLAIGVHGLKIEGRQKNAHYVRTAVHGWRRFLDALVLGRPEAEAAAALDEDLAAMTLAYSRGFADGWLAGSDHQTLVEGRFPKHRGSYLGRVRAVQGRHVLVDRDPEGRPWTGARGTSNPAPAPIGTVSSPLVGWGGSEVAASGPAVPEVPPKPGFGVVFDDGFPEDEHEPGGPVFEVTETRDGFRLGFGDPGPDLTRIRPGQRVWITSDPGAARATERIVRAFRPEGRVGLRLRVSGTNGEPLVVHGELRNGSATVRSRSPLALARGAGIDATVLREKLGTFGGSCFRLLDIDARALAPGLHLPVSEIKALRRELVDALQPIVDAGHRRELRPDPVVPLLSAAARSAAGPQVEGPPRLIPLVRDDAQLEAVIAAGLDEVELDWMELVGLGRAVARARGAGLRVIVATLRIGKPGEEGHDDFLLRLAPDGVLVRSFGALEAFRARVPSGTLLRGDFGLNVTNSITASHLLSRGLATLTASFDLDESQLFALVDRVPRGRLGVVVHHRIPTFHTEHCVYAHLLSQGRDHRSCGRPCEGHRVALRDSKGREHPVIVDAGCRNTVFNAEAQSLSPLVPALLERGVRDYRVDFVREDSATVTRVLRAYQDLLHSRCSPADLLARLAVRPQTGVSPGRLEILV